MARCTNRQVRAGCGQLKALPCHLRFWRVTSPAAAKTFIQPLEAPDVVRVDAGAREVAGKAKILSICLLSLLNPALLQRQGPKGMAHWLDPALGLVIWQCIFQLDCFAQVVEGLVIVALAVLQLAVQHLLGHIKQIDATVIMQVPTIGHLGARLHESCPLGF